jgi:hypothetical protein
MSTDRPLYMVSKSDSWTSRKAANPWKVLRVHEDCSTTTIGHFAKRSEAIQAARLLAGWRGAVVVNKARRHAS